MAKEITRVAKLQFNAGQAKPGPELAGLGIKMPEFTKQFNDATKERGSEPVPVQITVYKDRSFDFKLFTAPASYKILKAANISKGSSNSKTEKVGIINLKQLKEIAEYKLIDLNTNNIDSAMKIVAGTAKNMGVMVEGIDNIEDEKKAAEEALKSKQAADAKLKQIEEDAKLAVETKDDDIVVVATSQKSDSEDEEN